MSEYFFPNQSPDIMKLDERFRQHVAKLDEPARLALYEIVATIGPSFVRMTFSTIDDLTVAYQADRQIFFPF